MDKERILVLCAHSDDQILGPGGTLTKYAKEGKEIKTIIFSYGEGSHPHLKREVIVKRRVNEAQLADKIIGGNGVVFLGLKEGHFEKEIKERKIEAKLIRIIKDFKPHKIFTHSDEDQHPDHRYIINKVLEITDLMNYKGDIYMFDIWNLIRIQNRDLPKLYVDISDTFKIKIKALKSFSSQWVALLLLLWTVYYHAIRHGFSIKKKYAERFYKIR